MNTTDGPTDPQSAARAALRVALVRAKRTTGSSLQLMAQARRRAGAE
jgi:hypothetical protein